MHNFNQQFLQFQIQVVFCVFCFIKIKLSVKVKLFVSLLLLCVCAILPAKAISEMTYTVSGRTLNPTHSFIHVCLSICDILSEMMCIFTVMFYLSGLKSCQLGEFKAARTAILMQLFQRYTLGMSRLTKINLRQMQVK